MSIRALEHFTQLAKRLEAGRSCVVVTLVSARGHVPQSLGAKIIVTAEGLEHGTVGGGKVEARAIREARACLDSQESAPVSQVIWNLQRDLGMTCGGEVGLLFEVHRVAPWEIAIFGAGHVAQALVPLLLTLQCRVTCLDTRAEWLGRLQDSPKLTKRCVADLASEALRLPRQSFVVLITQGHATDVPILRAILHEYAPPYVGMIGSVTKAQVVRRELTEAGIAGDRVERLHCPVGLKLGSNDPSEIAISIAAQLIQERERLSVPS